MTIRGVAFKGKNHHSPSVNVPLIGLRQGYSIDKGFALRNPLVEAWEETHRQNLSLRGITLCACSRPLMTATLVQTTNYI